MSVRPLPERHFFLFYRWPQGQTDGIIARLAEHFSIRRVIRLRWSPEAFSLNVRRFYAHTPDQASIKRVEMGQGPFLLVIVDDPSPQYRFRVDGSCSYKKVNVNTFELKHAFRQEGLSVHSTDSGQEFYRDIIMLLGMRGDDLPLKPAPWDGSVEEVAADVIGTHGWNSLSEIFAVLNEGVNYVVLRSFEKLPSDDDLDPNKDIDLLVEDFEARRRTAAILNGMEGPYVNVGPRKVHFDVIEIEDCLYDPTWARDILKHRILRRGFYTPTDEDYFFSLLYRAHIHKASPPPEYLPRLLALAREIDLQGVTPDMLLQPELAADLIGKFLRGQQFHLTQPLNGDQHGLNAARRVERVRTLVLHETIDWREALSAATRRDMTEAFERRLAAAMQERADAIACTASLEGQLKSDLEQLAELRANAGLLEQHARSADALRAQVDGYEQRAQSRRWLARALLSRLADYPLDLWRRLRRN